MAQSGERSVIWKLELVAALAGLLLLAASCAADMVAFVQFIRTVVL